MATRWTSKHTGQKIDDTIDYVCNPNLLDNWYFANPVNQRGQTEYTPAWNGYSIDRWNVESDSEVVITLVNGGIHVKNTASTTKQFKQTLPSELNLSGKMVTISLLAGDVIGTVNCVFTQASEPYQNSAACSVSTNGLFSASGSVLTGQQKFACNLEPGAEITLLAVKLELGTTQTLAHQENGNWVLNEIPDYGEQLARCQRYFQTFATESLRPTNALDFRPVMRATPALSTITVGGKTLYTADADL